MGDVEKVIEKRILADGKVNICLVKVVQFIVCL